MAPSPHAAANSERGGDGPKGPGVAPKAGTSKVSAMSTRFNGSSMQNRVRDSMCAGKFGGKYACQVGAGDGNGVGPKRLAIGDDCGVESARPLVAAVGDSCGVKWAEHRGAGVGDGSGVRL
mmetsp:Transcript_23034/g.64406  ORF Transcript_23034/g.64406 Transcript_23034/m.64406 type:complete len:121 (+) Transcript_23034:968-1330(+)